MNFSINELKMLHLISKSYNIDEMEQTLKLSKSQIYRILQSLRDKDIIKKGLEPYKKTHINLLLNLLFKTINLSIPLSGIGFNIFRLIVEPKTILQIQKETGFHKTTIYKKIRQARKMSFIIYEDKKYRLNEVIWHDAKEFFIEFNKYDKTIDKRIPVSSVIYYKDENEIIFSNTDKIDAELTAFSAYSDYGIKIYTIINFYYLPRKELSKKEIFLHSLKIIEKKIDIQNIILLSLFYLKFKNELKDINHIILDNIKKIIKGEVIKGYPKLNEIKDRAEIYNL
jgi:predicted transcriptional regulator